MRALGTGRPRWSAGRRACIRASCCPRARRAAATRSTRSASRRARPTTSRPRGSSSRPAATPTRSARPRSPSSAGAPRWARSPSTPGRSGATTSTTPTSCASTSTRSRAPTSPDAVRVAGEARAAARRARLRRLPQDLGRPGRPRLRPHRAALDLHGRAPRGDRLRARARAAPAGPGDHQLVEGGARRAHLRRLQPERARPHDRLGLQRPAEAGRAGVRAADLGGAPGRRARGLHRRDHARPLRRGGRPPRGDRRRRPLAAAAAGHVRARRGRGSRRHAVPARLSEDAGRAQARTAVARSRPQAGPTRAPAATSWPRA